MQEKDILQGLAFQHSSSVVIMPQDNNNGSMAQWLNGSIKF
jgi:hypothetical protein